MTDTKRLRELAEAATPNYRRAPILKSDWPEKYNDVATVRGVRIIGDYKSVSCGDEADFIIAANPQAMIALIDELEKTKSKLEAAESALRWIAENSVGDIKLTASSIYIGKHKVTHE